VSHAGDERRYIRAVEAAWSRIQGRPAVVSPREFEVIDAWRRRGIPLAVVLEVLEAAGKRRSGRAPRALTALAPAVLDAWGVVAAGRAAPRVTEALPARSDAQRAWEKALAGCAESAPLRALLARLLAEEARGGAAAALDSALDEALPGAVPRETLARATAETVHALEEFRRRMSEEEFRKLFARALADRLRSALALPRFALTR